MDFSERLKLVIKRSGLKREEFAEKAGKSRTQLFNYLGGAQHPTADFFQAVKAAFPWVNIEWLITGIGDMESPMVGEISAEYGEGKSSKAIELILLMLKEMPEEKRQDVLKYAEGQKRLADLDAAESAGKKNKRRGAA